MNKNVIITIHRTQLKNPMEMFKSKFQKVVVQSLSMIVQLLRKIRAIISDLMFCSHGISVVTEI